MEPKNKLNKVKNPVEADAGMFLKNFGFTPTGEQLELFSSLSLFLKTPANECAAFILSGYAGTGKTTCLNALVRVAKTWGWSVQLLSPTGRAAKIISNKTGFPAHTLHRQLYKASENAYTGKLKFERAKNHKTNCLFIVDEASMIGAGDDDGEQDLLSDLVNFVYEQQGNKLVLVGDTAQLPPVGNSISPALQPEVMQFIFQLPTKAFQLKEVVRQHKDSGILHQATLIRQCLENPDAPDNALAKEDFSDVYQVPENKLKEGIRYAYEKYGLHESLLLCATNQEAARYNQFIRQEVLGRKMLLEPGDLLIVARNNYQVLPKTSQAGFLANGEFVEVLEVQEEESLEDFSFLNLKLSLPDYPKQRPFTVKVLHEVLVSKDNCLSPLRMKQLFELVLSRHKHLKSRSKQFKASRKDPYLNALQVKYAYALTCHKAQGGQWKAVFLKQGFRSGESKNPEQLRWDYTATTRASEELFWLK